MSNIGNDLPKYEVRNLQMRSVKVEIIICV
nr:MAG TPA: hypothetical protein [Caudoviricetes sp.]DAU28767.1 MAG TPA: hypothetical protein [Caudoviricetes sp.]